MIKINKEAYQKLITEDIEWLLKETERTLERDHIIEVLESSVSKYYPEFSKDKMREKSDKYVDDLYEELGDEISCSQSSEDFEAGYKQGWNDGVWA